MKKISTVLICFYMFSIIWDAFFLEYYNLPFFPTAFALIPLLCIFLLTTIIKNKMKFILPKFSRGLLFLLLYASFSLMWTNIFEEGLIELLYMYIFMITALVIFNLIVYYNISTIAILISYVLGILSITFYSISSGGLSMERFSLFENYNPSWYAAYLVWAIISVALLSMVNNKIKHAKFIIILLLFVFLFLTQGRNALLAVVAGFLAATLFFIKETYRINKSSGLVINKIILFKIAKLSGSVLILILIIVYFFMTTDWAERLTRVAQLSEFRGGDPNLATAGRFSIWDGYRQIILGNMPFGSGVSSYNTFGNRYSPHNNYISLLIDYGIPGLGLWFYFLFSSLYYAFKIKNIEYKFAIIWTSITFFFLGIGNDILYYRYWWSGVIILFVYYSQTYVNQLEQ